MIDRLRRAVAPAVRARPDFLVVGAQKAGTTSLHSYLGTHRRLDPCRGPKELHFFDLHHDRGLGWYLSHFPPRFSGRGRLRFESTPDYLGHPDAPARIARALGRVKLVAVLREPADRALSAWRMWHHFGRIRPEEGWKADARSFADAIEEEMAAPSQAAGGFYRYVAAGLYAEHLARYRLHFAPEDMLVLNYDAMRDDLAGFLGRITAFLGVAPFDPEAAAALGRVRHWAGPAAPGTETTARAIERLRDHYRPHNERLFEMIGERWAW